MRVLVTGGAGYIGSIVTEMLIEQGHKAVVMDSLAHGNRAAVHPDADFHRLDLLDVPGLEALFASHSFDAVVHLAAEAAIADSMTNPGLYFRANINGGIHLLDAMARHGVKKIVFSSTAAVFGEPRSVPIFEDAVKDPVNSYGESKLLFERALPWYQRAHDLRHVTFRYFNACGASKRFGEWRRHETHIIPILFEVLEGRRPQFTLFGTDYDTHDGTCIRDYLHVRDIAQAHLLALEKIDDLVAEDFNLGNGQGFTNRQVVQAVEKASGTSVPVADGPRRPGDPAVLVASSEKAKKLLGWKPEYPDLDSMVETAWAWRRANPEGYAE